MRKLLLLFFIFQCQVSLSGQAEQEVLMRVFPNNAFLKIDTQVIIVAEQPTPFILSLKPGKYPLEIWASRFEVFRDTLIVEENTKPYSKVLTRRSASFENYKIERKIYNKNRLNKIGITTGLIVGNIGALYFCVRNTRLDKLEEKATRHRVAHLNLAVPATLARNRAAFEDANREYKRERTVVYLKRSIGIPLVLLSSYFSQKYLKKRLSKKLEEPKIKEDKNPFVFNSLELNTIDAACQLSLKFKF